MAWNKMNLELNSRRGLFNAKRPKSAIFIYLHLNQHDWGALAPQGDLRSKNARHKMFLELNLRRGLCQAKMTPFRTAN
jgi:hypothetical protein